MLATAKVSLVRAIFYIISQCAGASAGSWAIKSLLPAASKGAGHTMISENIDPMQGLGVEFFLGFVLIFCICGVCDENKPGFYT